MSGVPAEAPHTQIHVPLLFFITLCSLVLLEFPSETHPDLSLIPTSPSVTFPPLWSLYCLKLVRLSASFLHLLFPRW